MACSACSKASAKKFVWTSSDGEHTIVYDSEIAAKMKVQRKGGTYKPQGG